MKRNYTGAMDCSPANKVALVERNPGEMLVVDPNRFNKTSKVDLIELACEIEKADDYIKMNAQNKLLVIVEQMKFLKKQAESVLLEAKENHMLHHAACNFVKIPGNIYHLYERSSGQVYFSMLSPEEWGSNNSQIYKGSYRLEHDKSWTPLSQIKVKDAELNIFNEQLSINKMLMNFPESMNID